MRCSQASSDDLSYHYDIMVSQRKLSARSSIVPTFLAVGDGLCIDSNGQRTAYYWRSDLQSQDMCRSQCANNSQCIAYGLKKIAYGPRYCQIMVPAAWSAPNGWSWVSGDGA